MTGHVDMSAPVAEVRPVSEAESRVLAKSDIRLRGEPACRVRFVYGGGAEEDLFWEEPCTAITVRLMTQAELQTINKWSHLDDFAQASVSKLPGGRVLYVEGKASASVYPVAANGMTYDVSVAD